MTRISEKGHVLNAVHFDEFLKTILTFNYQPSNERLKVEPMKIMLTACKNVLNDVSQALATFKAAVDAREPLFSNMNKLVSRIINILKSSDVPDETVETCKSIARKLHGRRTTPKRSPEKIKEDQEAGILIRENSSSQRSYDNQVENFKMLVEQIINVPAYNPNEADLQKENLSKLAEELKQKNSEVVSARTALKDARTRRDNLMYKKDTGLVDVALDAKSYIRGAFGPSSAEFRKVAKLEFSRN